MISLDITGDLPAGLSTKPLQTVVGLLNDLPSLTTASGQVNLLFTGDEEIQALNNEYAGNDYATDVLSFSYIEDGGEAIDGVIGEMAISLETAAVQAAKAGTDLDTEVALLGLHGILHILGYDHEETSAKTYMDGLQAQIMHEAALDYRDFGWLS